MELKPIEIRDRIFRQRKSISDVWMNENPSGMTGWVFWAVGGALTALAFYSFGDSWCGAGMIWHAVRGAFSKVGIVLIGLLPMGVWVLMLVVKQLAGQRSEVRMRLDYAYIARSATVLGLLGTITSLGFATTRLAGDVAAGSSSAILKVIPLTGQALVSTMVGLVIALIAETALHVMDRKEEGEFEPRMDTN